MNSKLKDKFNRQGFLIVKNILDFNFDLKPVLNDIEFVMNRLVYKFVSKKKYEIVFKYNFWKKYTYLSKLKIHDFDQYFNIRLPKENLTKNSDFFGSQSVFNLIKNNKILNVLEKLLGPEIMSNPVQNSRIKQPEKFLSKDTVFDGLSGRTPWHQDAGVMSVKGQKFTDLITVWVPFTKTTKKNGCMLTINGSHKIGLLNHVSGHKGQAQIRNSKLLNKIKPVALEADIGDIVILTKHTVHCSLPNISNNFRISMDLRYNKAGQPSGREALPSFYVRSKNKKNITVNNYKKWLTLWEKAKVKCLPRKYTFKYKIPTFKNTKRDLENLI
jgi:phytanoyl-CoA hydroxylase